MTDVAPATPSPIRRVLFVCHANCCRSPLAEGLFRHLVSKRDLASRFEIDSAGTLALEGGAPHPFSVEVGRRFGFEVAGSGRQILRRDLSHFDEILLMDRANRSDLNRLAAPSAFGPLEDYRARIRLLREIGSPDAQGADLDVPDPIGKADDAYEACYRLFEIHCEALLRELVPEAFSA